MIKNKYNILSNESLASTQTSLIGMDLSCLPEWTILIAKNQTSGRGQSKNVWESEDGKNLTFSILLKPSFINIADQFLITQVLSLGIYDFLSKHIQDVYIKWPNDIYVKKNKIGGILVNNKLQGEDFTFSICGIGLNINQTSFSNSPNPTSMKIELDEDFNLEVLLIDLLDSIYSRYDRLRVKKISDYKAEYISKLLYYNIWAEYEYEGNLVEAKILDVNQYGHLILIKRDKTRIEADLKQLKFCH
ncbi:MAG: biotin--[acetyl-CoA-carboxylase] ligase [Bacteroidales bacterium]